MQLLSTVLGLALLSEGAALAQEMELRVELMGPLGTKISHKGDRIFAHVVEPLTLKGDTVEGRVTEVRSGGKLRGQSVLNFSFETLQHAGQAVPINTQIRAFQNSKGQADLDEEGRVIRKGGGNLGKAAAGTGVGGMIGGIAGGWKGAAIGAGAGAVASIAIIEIAADSPEIRFDPGSIVTVGARSRSNQDLAALAGAPAAYPAGPAAEAPPAAGNTAMAPAAAPPASGWGPVNPGTAPAGPAAQPNFTALKDDFVAGEKILFYDDFTDMAPDDAPPHWKVRGNSLTLMAAGELRQLSAGARTTLTPLFQHFPKNFTLETDLAFGAKNGGELIWSFFRDKSDNEVLHVCAATSGDAVRVIVKTDKEGLVDSEFPVNWHRPIKEALWVQNGRIRLYFNGTKVSDFNQVELADLDNARAVVNYFRNDGIVSFSRVRLAESAPDFSRSIMATGRYVTHGILFDTGSDRLKPESGPVIKSVAFGLQANTNLKLKIEGHTDARGDAALNLDLSRRRAEAVKQVLVTQFQIDGARLTTDGLGATKPVDPNDTPQGRAQNRRVEFIKQ